LFFLENIEDAKGCLQIDFANKYLGGGVLTYGCVQEEIRFCVSPELFPSMILCECMNDEEAVIIYGAEQYSKYDGYGSTFQFKGNNRDNAEINKDLQRLDVTVVAIDARNYAETLSKKVQFKTVEILRELNKALVGFRGDDSALKEGKERKCIATGRWGCGAFEGDSQLKFVIQWIAASEVDRGMIFYPYGDNNLKGVRSFVEFFKGKKIGKVFRVLSGYMAYYNANERNSPMGVLDFLKKNCN
jgi:poly(ADP-ribose) glycohydrolase